MGKTEQAVLRNVVRRLRGENSSPEVAAALKGPARVYLETWVIPALEILAGNEDRDLRLALSLTRLPAQRTEG